MSTLYFIRHGQASFGKANYDKLSSIGEKQSKLLGEYFVRWNIKIDALYTGSLERQRHTAIIFRDVFIRANKTIPEILELDEFNEYDTRHLLTGSISDVLAQNPEVLEVLSELKLKSNPDLVNNKKLFQKIFSRVMELWMNDRIKIPGMESWRDFNERVNRGIDKIINEQGSGKVVMVFSSGGPISVAMQRALKSPDIISLELGWVIVNSSITEFLYTKDKFSLVSFNKTPHLDEPELITYR